MPQLRHDYERRSPLRALQFEEYEARSQVPRTSKEMTGRRSRKKFAPGKQSVPHDSNP